jgi:hypothetical protein
MAFRGKAFKKQTQKAVVKAALAADTTAVLATPVDTGRARANWIASIGSPTLTEIGSEGDEFDRGGASALAQGKGAIAGWKLRAGPIFITNSLPYIVPLDTGSSSQAPHGMSASAIAAARRELKKIKLLKTRV